MEVFELKIFISFYFILLYFNLNNNRLGLTGFYVDQACPTSNQRRVALQKEYMYVSFQHSGANIGLITTTSMKNKQTNKDWIH
jgi:hypothetical protein